ncbi:DNA primase [Candidatus Brocadiaceae bacterium]|nr:DNA primase [Candidatus Dojkabacteria bacterium]CAG0943242.1 DNA primase [Candidatus Brocadiaceae bacterium]
MSDIENIKAKLDIVDVIGSYVPDLKKAGVNFKARCPFHSEKTPSFTVNPSLQIFKCFGCGKVGDVIKFIEEIEHTDFADALKIAAEKAGIELTRESSSKNSKEKAEKEKLLNANWLTAKYYNYILTQHKSGKKGLEYATKKRKIDLQRIHDFLVGYAPNKTDNLKKFLISKGFEEKDLIRWGLLVERNNKTIDKFRERLIQPIFNLKGEVVAFSGRYIGSIKEAPKYLNSPETLVYKKKEMLYGLHQAKEFLKDNNFLILVEGNIDILSSHRVEIGNIVAPLGTALTINQAKLIKRFGEYVYFCFDTDAAGTKALIRGMGIAEEIELKHKVIDLTGYQDADDLIKAVPEEWKVRIENAKQTMDYLIEKFSEDLDMGSAEGKSVFESRILPCLSLVKDEVLFNHYRKTIASILEVSENFIDSRANKLKAPALRHSGQTENEVVETKPSNNTFNPDEKYLLQLLVYSNLLESSQFDADNFLSDSTKTVFTILKENPEVDFGILESKLPQEYHQLFEDIIMFEVRDIDIKKEINSTAQNLRKEYINKRLMQLRKEFKLNPEDLSLMEEVDVLTKERKSIDSKNYSIV